MKTATGALLVSVLSLTLFIAGCGDDTETVIQPGPLGTVTFNVDNQVDSDPLQFNQLLYTNSRGTNYSVSKLVYLLSNITLHATDGSTYGIAGPHFRDHADPDTRSFSIAGVPKGTYDMISFTFGLDEAMNVQDVFAGNLPPWHGEMAWSPVLGGDQGLAYHYMKIEGNYEETPGGETNGYGTHTGARWCANPCGPAMETDLTPKHHHFRVSLPVMAMAVSGDRWTVTLVVDINGWYTDHSPGDGFDTEYDWKDLPMQMIMANADAQRMLKANGPGCFRASVAKAP